MQYQESKKVLNRVPFSPVLGLHSRSLEQIMSNHLRRIKQSKILCGRRDSNPHTFSGTTF